MKFNKPLVFLSTSSIAAVAQAGSLRQGRRRTNTINMSSPYGNKNDEHLGPAAHCLDLKFLEESYVSYTKIDAQVPCLKDYCASLTTAEECNLEENFKKGCGWCSNSCKPFSPYQDAFIQCVRDAYADYEPDKINGQALPATPSLAQKSTDLGDFAIGVPEQGGIPNLGNKRWSHSSTSRSAGNRVPIHIHPFTGMSCINSEGGSMVHLEGHEPFFLPDGECYSMPPMTKLGPYSATGSSYVAYDTFEYEACYPQWVVIEPGMYEAQGGQFVQSSDLVCD